MTRFHHPLKLSMFLIALLVVIAAGAAHAAPPRQGADDLTIAFGYTYQQPDGNRYVTGRGSVPTTPPLDIPLAGEPEWIVAAPAGDGGTIWAVTLQPAAGSSSDLRPAQAFHVSPTGAITPVEVYQDLFPVDSPPLLAVADSLPTLYDAALIDITGFTHPVVLPESGQLVFLLMDGNLLFVGGESDRRLPVNALPDARLLVDDQERLLLLTDPTTRYDHGILGDSIEASSVTLVETAPEPRVVMTIPIGDPAVIEGIAPIWTDLNGDGVREIIVTVSDQQAGARLHVYDERGGLLAAGPAIGQGYRWRHQIAAAPFGPNGETELVDVLTPHTGGVVEFFGLDGDRLELAAQVPGFTSHIVGSRNLDMAMAGDFDGDGRVEILLPTQDRQLLGGIRRTADGAEVAWLVPLDGQLASNLAAVTLPDGRMVVGAGRSGGVLRLWLPQ